jgi:hypothetical protein
VKWRLQAATSRGWQADRRRIRKQWQWHTFGYSNGAGTDGALKAAAIFDDRDVIEEWSRGSTVISQKTSLGDIWDFSTRKKESADMSEESRLDQREVVSVSCEDKQYKERMNVNNFGICSAIYLSCKILVLDIFTQYDELPIQSSLICVIRRHLALIWSIQLLSANS